MAHKHAELMKMYAEDAAKTDKPWERWEYFSTLLNKWVSVAECGPLWAPETEYRRKRIPLCQVEGKDVFPGDRLWHEGHQKWLVAYGPSVKEDFIWCEEGYHTLVSYLSWSEPSRTKTVYQWAALIDAMWLVTSGLYETEEELRKDYGSTTLKDVRRLDYTALEVPA